MGQIEQFFINHWGLWLAFAIVLLLILVNELQANRKRAKQLSPQAAVNLINHDNAVIVDLRDAEAFRKGHIIGSIRSSKEDFDQNRMDKYKTTPLVLVCASGLQSATLAASLREKGFNQPFVLSGGIAAWQLANLPLIKGK